jgi:rhodanese-related sulfurtransferase
MKNFIATTKRFLPLILLAGALAGCSTTMIRTDLQKSLLEKQAPLIVDVRSESEFNSGHIPGAVHIPFYSIGSGLGQLAFPKEKPVVLYCEHGPRAALAGISLYFHGFEKVYSLEGHMKGWRENGLSVEKAAGASSNPSK